jgi:hypothetical protein
MILEELLKNFQLIPDCTQSLQKIKLTLLSIKNVFRNLIIIFFREKSLMDANLSFFKK